MGEGTLEDGRSNLTYVDMYRDSITVVTPDYIFQDNSTTIWDMANRTNGTSEPQYLAVMSHINVILYLLICALGLVGNGLVIYVVLMYAKMKTVTNMYILNLALTDVLFLTMLPITVSTVIAKHWMFGFAMCKIYFVVSAVNIYGGAFNLCIMSADRYLAVCHPIKSMKYRTPRIAFILCLCVWALTFVVMLPVIMYTTELEHSKLKGKYSCNIHWPADQVIPPDKAFILYSFILGFAIPVSLISVFYVLVILRLRHVGAVKKTKEKRRSHGRVTRLVLTVITVYVVCWLPYWCFQVHHVVHSIRQMGPAMVLLFNGFTVLSYANSMLNPFLYAFLSDNFRQSFMKAFKCLSSLDMGRSVCNEKSVFPCTSQTYTRAGVSAAVEERVELYTMDNSVAAPPAVEQNNSVKAIQDEHGFLKPPVQL